MVSTPLQNLARFLWRWGASPCTAPRLAPAPSHDSAATGRSLNCKAIAAFLPMSNKAKGLAFRSAVQSSEPKPTNNSVQVHKWFTCPKVPALPMVHTSQKSWSSLSTPQSLTTQVDLQQALASWGRLRWIPSPLKTLTTSTTSPNQSKSPKHKR